MAVPALHPLRALAAFVAVAFVMATTGAVASAQTVSVAPTPLAPANGASHTAGTSPPTFRARTQPGDSYLWVHVSRSPATDAKGILASDVTLSSLSPSADDGSVYEFTPMSYTFPGYWLVTPGTYYWQAYRISYMSGADGAIEGPVQRLDVTAAPAPPPPPAPTTPTVPGAATGPVSDAYAGLSRALMPSSVGRPNYDFAFRTSPDDLPPGVARDRWLALAETVGARWGMTDLGETYGAPYTGDGSVEVGFGYAGAGSLGAQTDLFSIRYRKARRVCKTKRVRSRGRVRRVRRCYRQPRKIISRRLVDSDVTISNSPSIAWQQGPARPAPFEHDLETVLIHELGHLAGNMRHAGDCQNTPMIESLGRGEWWRSPADFAFGSCGIFSARAASADHTGDVFERRVRTVSVDVDAPATAAGDHASQLERAAAEQARNGARQQAAR